MKKILFLALVLLSTKIMYADDLPKDTLWTRIGTPYHINNAIFSQDNKKYM